MLPSTITENSTGQVEDPVCRIANDMSAVDRMCRKLKTKAGKKTYSRRKESVEAVFGQIKQARGVRQYLLRGIEKVRAEWRLICLEHNLLKIWRAGRSVSVLA